MSGYNAQDEQELDVARKEYWRWEQHVMQNFSMAGAPGEYHLAANRFVLAAEAVIADLRNQLREAQRRAAHAAADEGRG